MAELTNVRVLSVFNPEPDGSKWGNRLGASIDSYQAGLYGVAEAVTGSDWARRRREENEADADWQREQAARQGAIMSYKDVGGVGDALDYVGGLAVDSLPYLIEAGVGGLTGGSSLVAGNLARAGISRGVARTLGGVAASYPSSVGDILQNQREENGTTNLGAALAGGVPYAALNALGIEGALARGTLTRSGIRALDEMTGLKGVGLRTGASMLKNAAVEGPAETGQELINQSFGRMAVNPDQTLFNPEANERYAESFVGGAALGGVFGGAAGGWRRSEGYLPPGQNVDNPEKPADLLAPSAPSGTQGQLFGDLGIDGLMSELPADRDPNAAVVNRYRELQTQLNQLEAGMSNAQESGNAELFYRLQGLSEEIKAQMRPLERTYSAIQAQATDNGQMGLFGSGPSIGIELPQIPNAPVVEPYVSNTPLLNAPRSAPLIATTDGLVGTERQFSGQQYNLFDGPTTFGEAQAPTQPVVAPQRDTQTRDMFAETPTAMVPTMFNPAGAPGTMGSNLAVQTKVPGNAPVGQRTEPSRGAVAGEIRSRLMQQLQGAGDATTAMQLSLDLAAKVGDLQGMLAAIGRREQAIQKNLNDLDKKVSRGSDLLTPEEYAAEREVLDSKLLTIEAARTLAEQYQQALTNAYADEGRSKARPGATVGVAPVSNTAEQEMRDNSMGTAVAETDARVARSKQANTADRRMGILREVMARQNPANPVRAFRKALRQAGFNNLDVTPDEQAEINRLAQRRDDVAAATVLPPGLVAARGRLTPRSSLDGNTQATDAAPVQPSAAPDVPAAAPKVAPAQPQPTAAPAASAQPAASVNATNDVQTPAAKRPATAPAAGGVPRARGDAAVETAGTAVAERPVTETSPEPAPAAKPKRASKEKAMGSSVESLIEAVETESDPMKYDGALDALYRRYMETEVDAESDAIIEYVEAQGKAFAKDWKAAEKRYDDTERGVTGKRGLAQKNDAPTSEQIHKSAEADILRGVWARFSQGGVPSGGQSVTAEQTKKIVQKVLRTLGIADVVRIETLGNPADAGLTAPDGVVPAGVTLEDGRILIFADNIGSEIDVFRTVFHELFHLGLSKSLGQGAYIQQMLKFKLDPLVREYAERWKKTADGRNRKGTLPVNNYEALSVEEALADIAEDLATDKLGSRQMNAFVRSMVGKLADFAQAVGLDKVAQQLRRMTYSQAERFVMDTLSGAKYDAPSQLRGQRFNQANSERELSAMERESGTPESFTQKWKSTPLGYLIRDIAAGWRGQPWLLGMLTLDQIKDRFTQFNNVGHAVDTWLKMGSRATEIMRLPSTLHKQWATLTRKDRATSDRLNKLFIDATIAEAWVDGDMEPRLDPRNKHLDFSDPEVAKAVAEARSKFVALPKEAKQLYRDVTSELTKQFRMKQDAMLKRVVDVYKDALAGVLSPAEMLELAKSGKLARAAAGSDFKPNMTAAQRIELQRFFLAVDSAYIPTNQVPGPYFPLTRRGDHVVVFKSDSFKVAEQRLKDARATLDNLLAQDPPSTEEADQVYNEQIKAAKEAVTAAKKAVELSKGSELDYVVEFYDSRSQAMDARARLAKEKGVPLSEMPGVLTRQQFSPRTDSLPAGFLNKLEDQLRKELPAETRADIASLVRQMVIQSMPEKSAFKSELRRMRVAGVNPEDAMFSFVSASHRNAWTISRLENVTELSEAMNQARASENQDERIVGNELMKRYAKTLEYNPGNALIDMASNLSYITHLGFSVGYYVQNMTQPWLVSMPVLAGKYGFGATNTALADATVDVVKAMHQTIKQGRTHNNWEMPLDLDLFKGDEGRLLEMLTNKGRIDITIRADLGVGSSLANNAVGHVLQKAAELSSLPAHQVEVVNRVATALAAFRLAKNKTPGISFDDAAVEADKIVVQTHVDYSLENAPRFMNPNALGGLGRLTFQFRRYQQAMVFLWGKTLADAIRHGDKDSARALMYLSGVNLAMAGASGVPLAAPMGLVLAAASQWGDEDEERDLNELFWAGVRAVAGDTVTDLARKGIPASVGLDVSQRIGAGNILSPVFNMPRGQTGQEWAGAWALQLFGATGGTVSNWADAVILSQDNPAMAIQKTLPAGIKGWFQAIDREQRGLTDRRGNVMIGEDELGGMDFMARFLNLGESTKVTNMYQQRNAVVQADMGRQDVRRRLMREYTRARLDGDMDAMRETRKEIDAFNARNPREVQILPKNLTASFKQEQVRQREMRTGIRVNDRNRDIAEDYGVEQ